MYIITDDGKWEWLSYTYELPWKTDDQGKSRKNVSRIKIGIYDLTVREDGQSRLMGGKGWRMQLQDTAHRNYIQIHRAASNLYIEGCILPVHFNWLHGSTIQKNDTIIRNKSVQIMNKIQSRYNSLSNKNKGNASVTISAHLPAKVIANRSNTHA